MLQLMKLLIFVVRCMKELFLLCTGQKMFVVNEQFMFSANAGM